MQVMALSERLMAVFEYKGFDNAGKAVAGIIDSDSQKGASAKLRRQGL